MFHLQYTSIYQYIEFTHNKADIDGEKFCQRKLAGLSVKITLSVSQPLTTIAELTQFCKANTLTNTLLSTAHHTQCQSAFNHHC